ncbi:TonB-dependent receptor [candidate division KSB1 bacterium]|nr:TonB-dependent receptor [candidate division KSB1 bacterium]
MGLQHFYRIVYCTLLMVTFHRGSLIAQPGYGKIVGVVSDSITGNPLPGANVFLEGTAIGAATDLNGKYVVSSVPPGNYTLRVRFIGYKTKDVSFRMGAGETKEFDVMLALDVVEGKTVTITAQAEGQVAAINQQLRSNTITNVVSAERIQEFPDANAAESVGRLPGISIKRSGGEGNKVVIRGLAPTYNTITIGGEKIPATDLDDRSVDLNMISPEILAGIEVTKALTPDKDADAFGGIVNFQLATAPEGGPNVDVRYKQGYNSLRDEFGQYKGSLTLSNRYANNRIGLMITGNLEETQRGSDVFQASYEVPREKREGEEYAPVTVSSVSLRYRDEVRKRTGFNVIMDYRLNNGKIMFSNFMSRLDRHELTNRETWSESNTHTLRSYDIIRQIDIISNSLAGEHSVFGGLLDWRLGRTASSNREPFNRYIYARELSAIDFSLLPQVFGPDELLAAAFNDYDEMTLYGNNFYQEKSFERDQNAQMNFKLPYTLTSKIAGNLKIGGKVTDKIKDRDRTHWHRRVDYLNANDAARHHPRAGDPDFELKTDEVNDILISNYLNPSFDAGNFLNGDYDMPYALSHDDLNYLYHHFLADSFNRKSSLADLDDYEVHEIVTAGYAMAEINFGRFLMFLPGARYEYTQAYMTGRKGSVPSDLDEGDIDDPVVQDTSATASYGRWFPMIHMRVKPTEWFDIRLAYTKSLSRARLSQMLPKRKVDGSERRVEFGRPDLLPQISTNYDVFLSFYSNTIGLFTLGGFYKEIDDLIFSRDGHFIIDAEKEGYARELDGHTVDQPENNKYLTQLRGFEIDWQTRLTWLPGFLDGIVLNMNYSHIWSSTHFPRSRVVQEKLPVFPFVKTTVVDTFRTGNMPDQSDDIANIGIGYDKGKFSGRVFFLYQGRTLSSVGERPELDGFTADLLRVDFSAKYSLTPYLDLFYNWNNITNEPDESYQLWSRNLTDREYYGWTMDIGLTLKL